MGILSSKTKKNLEEGRASRRKMRKEMSNEDAAELYFSLISKMPIGIIVHDRDKILYVNRHSCMVLGRGDPSALIGHPVDEIIPEKQQESYWSSYEELLDNSDGTSARMTQLCRIDGSVVEVCSLFMPVEIARGVVAQVVFVNEKTLGKIVGLYESDDDTSIKIDGALPE